MISELRVEPLPGLAVAALVGVFARPLGEGPVLAAPSSRGVVDEGLRTGVRDVLRQRGYRPTGRGKPSAEYLAQALAEGRWPRINAAVDGGNLASLRTGLPISVVDLDLVREPLGVRVAAADLRYVFNQGGQEIEVGGLPCLFDADGPCANAVKDAQRTKTRPETVRVLGLVWGIERGGPELVEGAVQALASHWRDAGADVVRIAVARAATGPAG